MFTRSFSQKNIAALKVEPLFLKYLLPDILASAVFPGIRDNRIDFYHRGGKLFSFDKGFTTHHKYASVLQKGKNDYIREGDLKSISNIETFSKDSTYKRIKENCASYAGNEAEGVSHLYNRFSCTKEKLESDIVVLDIEASFENNDDNEQPTPDRKRTKQDRIDIVLFHKVKREIRFYEAKLFINKEIRAKTGETPEIIAQMNRYRKQLGTTSKRSSILEQYCEHIRILNELFACNLPMPSIIDPEPRLYIFGFDDDQRLGKLKRNLETLHNAGIFTYERGGPKSVDIKSLWGD